MLNPKVDIEEKNHKIIVGELTKSGRVLHPESFADFQQLVRASGSNFLGLEN